MRAPVQLKGGDQPIKTQSPGYATPCLHDLDGDGKKQLLVGQFANGYIYDFKGLGDGKFAKEKLLEVDGQPVKIPGVKPISLGKFETLTTGTKMSSRWKNENAFVGDSSRLWVDDLNGDGKLDLIAGDRVSLKSPLAGAFWEEAREQIKALDLELIELTDKLSKIPAKEARQERNKKGL